MKSLSLRIMQLAVDETRDRLGNFEARDALAKEAAELESALVALECAPLRVPLWLRCAINKMHDRVDHTDPRDPVGVALTCSGLERRMPLDGPMIEDVDVIRRRVRALVASHATDEQVDELIAAVRGPQLGGAG